ncbi:MAG: hypothetical protein IKW30_06690 [Lachnospiraceae bacterium]|nr:hypothetical protein [Lachnospiraceae bacterium]
MTDNILIKQNSSFGSETTQIANQTNYYGLTPEEASKLAIDLFMNNFPKLQDEAYKVAQSRVDELISNIVLLINQKYNTNFTAFSKPDMQYILLKAEQGYARRGTTELCSLLSSLIADRSACSENSYLELILDKAIELVPSLTPIHLDYISLIFLYKHVNFYDLTTLESIQKRFAEIHTCFQSPTSKELIPYLSMLGVLSLNLGNAVETLAGTYHCSPQEISKILPPEHKLIPGDYGLSPAGIILAIFNAHSKSKWKFDISVWIHE